jgi:two-component system nitrate/nitrite sensor histidine kinase NarX
MSLTRTGRGFELEVKDDGVGIELPVDRPGHIGIAAMRTRADEVGGGLEVVRDEPRGTRIRFRWPI